MEDNLTIENGVLTVCSSKAATVRVPQGVHTIGEGAFKGCTFIEHIILPDTVTAIEANAFKGCRRLTTISLSSALKTLGDYAFHRCHSLRSIHIPPSVESLGNCVFLYCDSLREVQMPGVKKLGLQVFLNDTALNELLISTELDGPGICDCFTSCANIRTIRFTDGTVYHLQNVVTAAAPDSKTPPLVRAIAADVCRMMEIEGFTMTRFLTNIKHVDVAEGITAVGKSCFFDKRGIVSVSFPQSLCDIGNRAFRNCISLERVEFQNDKAVIAEDAFMNCSSLRYIRMGDGREYELQGLACLSDQDVPQLVKNIHSQILGNFSISGTILTKYHGSEARVVVPEGITAIGERAFAGNEAIDRVILPDTVTSIGEEAFADCLVLQTINVPEGIQTIEEAAFINCVKLIRAVLPDSLTSVGKSCFKRCRNLNEVCLGADVTGIGPMAFYGCQKLKSITPFYKLEQLGDMAFYQCFALKEITLPPSLRMLGSNVFTLSGVQKAVVLCQPEQWGNDVFSQCTRLRTMVFGENVRHIGDKFAFGCDKLTHVGLPPALKTIGRNVFEGTRYLRELPEPKMAGTLFLDGSCLSGCVKLPEGTTGVAGGAFYGNKEITSIELPDSLVFLGPRAFCGCSGLTSVLLPSGVTILEEGVFAYCTSLECVGFKHGDGRITEIHPQAFIGCSSLSKVPSLHDCRCIGDMAFRGTGFLEKLKREADLVILQDKVICGENCKGDVIIPEGVAAISDYAFYGNHEVTSLVFPKSLKRIGAYGFSGCRRLNAVTFQGPVAELGEASFEKCASLTEVSIEAEVISRRAFAWCAGLRKVCCSVTVQVGDEAFCGCLELRRWEGNAVKTIGTEAFSDCGRLEVFPMALADSIGARAFERCDRLRRISLNGNTRIGAHAFEDCGCLEIVEVSMPPLDEGEKHPEGCVDSELCLGSYGFAGCTAIKTIIVNQEIWEICGYETLSDHHISQVVKQICASALSCFDIDRQGAIREYRTNGRFLAIPYGVREIGNQVFQDKNRLEEVEIPKSVTAIGARAFDKTPWLDRQRAGGLPTTVNNILIDGSGCKGEVKVPKETAMIAGWAFAGCLDLTGISFLSANTWIGEHAFRNCIHLKQITFANGETYCLDGLKSLAQISAGSTTNQVLAARMIEDCYNCFKTTESGVLAECTGNISRMTLPAGITAVGEGAFKDSNLLTVLTLAMDTKALENHAFEQCKWLEQVHNTAQVERIGAMAFSGCVRLKGLDILTGLKVLGERAFENCTSLEEIVLPEGLEEIPRRAFYRCHQLKSVHLPSTLQRIGEEAFAFCYELPQLQLAEGQVEIGSRAFAWCYGKEGDV